MTMDYVVGLLALLCLVQGALLFRVLRVLQVVDRADDRLAHFSGALALLTETTEEGFRTMATEIARSRRTDVPLSLLLCDLNSFKKINDAHGHLAGDNCLRQVADALRGEVRGADVCFRWGGDEFIVVLTDTPELAALEVAARIESHVAASCAQPDGSPLTVTSGHATLLDWMAGADLVAAADAALLVRKRSASAQPAS